MGVSKNRGKTPQNGWFIMEYPIKMDDFGGTIIFGNTHLVHLDTHNMGFLRFHPEIQEALIMIKTAVTAQL